MGGEDGGRQRIGKVLKHTCLCIVHTICSTEG